jgi:acyl carrier protein
MNIQTRIERFILDELLSGSARQTIDPEESLVTTGILDSLSMLRLITFLEEEFGMTIGDGDVGTENFETLRKMAAFIERKTAEAGGKAPIA